MAEAVDIGDLVSLVADIDVTACSDDEVALLVVEAERLLNAVHALSAVALEEFQRRGTWARDGALSAAGWVAGRTGSARSVLRARVRAGAGLRLLPAAASAARAGRLSPRHVAVLAGCARRHPGLTDRDEAVLTAQAEELDADAFGVVARHWAEHASAVEGQDPAAITPLEPADELHVSRTFDGRYQLNGSFSAETGQLVHAALEEQVDRQLRAARDGDPSLAPVASQVRARRPGRSRFPGHAPGTVRCSVPDRYRVAVVVRADATGPVPMAVCDAPAFRVVLGADSESARRRSAHTGVARRYSPRDQHPGRRLHLPRL